MRHAGTAFARMARTTPAEHEDPGLLLESADAIKDARDLDQDRAARTSVAPSGASAQDPATSRQRGLRRRLAGPRHGARGVPRAPWPRCSGRAAPAGHALKVP